MRELQMPKQTKKPGVKSSVKNKFYFDRDDVYSIIRKFAHEVKEDHAKSIDKCHEEHYTTGGVETETITNHYYWTGAADILQILCIRMGLIEKENVKIAIKRHKEFKNA